MTETPDRLTVPRMRALILYCETTALIYADLVTVLRVVERSRIGTRRDC